MAVLLLFSSLLISFQVRYYSWLTSGPNRTRYWHVSYTIITVKASSCVPGVRKCESSRTSLEWVVPYVTSIFFCGRLTSLSDSLPAGQFWSCQDATPCLRGQIIHTLASVQIDNISKTTKIFLDFRPFRALFLLSARWKEVTSITSLTSSQFTVEFINVSNIYLKNLWLQWSM